MTPSEIAALPTREVVDHVLGGADREEALDWLADVIADRSRVAALAELERRFAERNLAEPSPVTLKAPASIHIDPDRFKRAMWRRRLPMSQIGPMINRSQDIAYAWMHKRRLNYYTADELAVALGENVDSFIAEFCAPEEMERLGL